MKLNRYLKSSNNQNPIKLDNGFLFETEAIEFLSCIKSQVAEIVFLDPPFNLGKTYGNNSHDQKNDTDYYKFIIKVLKQSIRILKPGGAFYLYHVPKWAVVFTQYLNSKLTFRHWISISMKNSYARGKYLYPAHYALLYYTKGEPAYFTRPKIEPARCRHCNNHIKDYGGYKKYIENGINLSDVWDDLSPVRHKKYKSRTANELPIKLLNRVIEISGVPNGLLIDPFSGSGTSILSAVAAQMKFLGCDIEHENIGIIIKRLQNLKHEV